MFYYHHAYTIKGNGPFSASESIAGGLSISIKIKNHDDYDWLREQIASNHNVDKSRIIITSLSLLHEDEYWKAEHLAGNQRINELEKECAMWSSRCRKAEEQVDRLNAASLKENRQRIEELEAFQASKLRR